ncbi:MAG: D-TA family PLP-dependent enzyme [Cyclobacteriaceae bacterium]|nr:D-TA family PLP-dependent enzyme [Cyclobacteriaceae bacterium]
MNSSNWYTLANIHEIDTPALVVYPERVKENIRILKSLVPDTSRLRPHMKTSKSAEVAQMLLNEGITKYKCATIAEAEMLATAGARDVLLAYQPVGPKAKRLLELVKRFPETEFSCLIDNHESAVQLSSQFEKENQVIKVYLDINVGMNRTGIATEHALDLFLYARQLHGINATGLHAYDGHLRDSDFTVRKLKCNESFRAVENLRDQIIQHTGRIPRIIAGGTPTFPIHAQRENVECSPGTFIYWDKGYQSILHEQPFVFAALVITRIISKPNEETLCVDLGHKSIASENPIDKRVYFLNAPGVTPIGHSEEHMVLHTEKGNTWKVGDVLYGVPYHICPTVALHEEATSVVDQQAQTTWKTTARNRKITV